MIFEGILGGFYALQKAPGKRFGRAMYGKIEH